MLSNIVVLVALLALIRVARRMADLHRQGRQSRMDTADTLRAGVSPVTAKRLLDLRARRAATIVEHRKLVAALRARCDAGRVMIRLR